MIKRIVKVTPSKKRCIAFFVVLFLLIPLSAVQAEFSSTPDTSVSSDENILSVSVGSSAIYAGGLFEAAGFPSQPLVITRADEVSATTGTASTTFPTITNSFVSSSVSDGSNGFYIAGGFHSVKGISSNYIAHILSNGSVDASFLPNPDNPVLSLALSSDHSTLYVGGYFTTIGGQARNNIAALNTSDGSATSFDPDSDQEVDLLKLSPDGTTLYAASEQPSGAFTTIGGQTRNRLAALNTSDGTATAFDPEPDGYLLSLAISSDGSTLYVGGLFGNIGGQARNNIAALHTSDGTATSFNPDSDDLVGALALSSDNATLYIGCGCNNIGGAARQKIAALHTSDGTATSFNPGADFSVNGLTLSSDNTILYAGGAFTTISGQSRGHLAALHTSDGTLTSFDANATGQPDTLTLSSDGSELYVDAVGQLGGVNVNGIVAFNPTTKNHISSFDANTNAGDQVTVSALSPDGSTLYIGGFISSVDGSSRGNLAAINTADGTVTSFDPEPDDGVNSMLLSSDGSILYIGGYFTQVDGVTRNGLAAINASDGSLVSAFDPNVDDNVEGQMSLSSDGSILYFGGDFTHVGGTPKNHIAAVHTSDGSLVSSFAATANSNGGVGVRSAILSPDGATLYLGGNFTSVDGTTRNHIAAVHTSDGSLVTTFNPNADALVYNMALYPDGVTLYVTGDFANIGGHAITGLASVNTADGSINTSFSQNVIDAGEGLAISADGSKLYVGNGFDTSGQTYFAIFSGPPFATPAVAPTLTTSAASSITQTTATFNGNITATGGANPTDRGFNYGTTMSYGTNTDESGSFTTGAFTALISGLTCATTYDFRSYATNSGGTGTGSNQTFTTSACSSGGGGGGGGGSTNSGGSSIPKAFILPATSTLPPTTPAPTVTSTSKAKKPAATTLKTNTQPSKPPVAVVQNPPPIPNQVVTSPNTIPSSQGSSASNPSPSAGSSLIGMVKSARISIRNFLNDKPVQTLEWVSVAIPAAISVIALLGSIFGGVPAFNYFLYILAILAQLLGIKRASKPWGTIYDSYTKRPLPFARAEITNAESRKLQSAITDANGRYGFLVSEELSHDAALQLHAFQSKYVFPSVQEPTATEQILYPNIYRGGSVHIAEGLTNYDLPMDPVNRSFTPNFYFGIVSTRLNKVLSATADILFVVGALLGIANCIFNPSVTTFVILAVIIVAFVLRHSGFKLKPFGLTKDKDTKQAMPFGFIALHDISGARVGFTVSDDKGRYFLLTQKGRYTLKAYTPSHITPMRTAETPISTNNGWVSKEIGL